MHSHTVLSSPHSYSISRNHNPPNPPISYFHHIGRHPLAHRTIGQQLAKAAAAYGDREAIVSSQQRKRLTYAQFLDQADRLAAGYQKLGLRRGDRVGIWSPNTCEWLVAMMGAARAGLISVALNATYQPPEIGYCLQKVGMKAVVAGDVLRGQSFYDRLVQVVPELETAKSADGIQSLAYPTLEAVIINAEEKHA